VSQVAPVDGIQSIGASSCFVQTPRHKPLKLIQLRMIDMKDYHSEAKHLRFHCIPFTKVKAIKYTSNNIVMPNTITSTHYFGAKRRFCVFFYTSELFYFDNVFTHSVVVDCVHQ